MSLKKVPMCVIRHICTFIPLIDAIALSHTCKRYRAIVVDPISRIRAIIPPDLQENLIEYGGILSGSFLLHILTNCGYNDIDVFYTKTFKYSGKINHTLCIESKYFNLTQITKVTYHDINYDFIKIVNIPLNEYINRAFDLNICKNTYDGRVFRIHDLQALFARRDVMKLQVNFQSAYFSNMGSRLKKYRKRGFEITLDTNFEIIINHFKSSNRWISDINKNIIRIFKLQNLRLRELFQYKYLHELCSGAPSTECYYRHRDYNCNNLGIYGDVTLGYIFIEKKYTNYQEYLDKYHKI